MDHKVRLGPIAIFLTIIAMVITTLAVLTVATSNADRVMAGRFANITQTRYELEADGERFLAGVAAGDVSGIEGASAYSVAAADAESTDTPADESVAENTTAAESAGNLAAKYSYMKEQDGYRLEIEVSGLDAEGYPIVTMWKLSRIWQSSDPISNIWQGF